jgi:hypothetical protein
MSSSDAKVISLINQFCTDKTRDSFNKIPKDVQEMFIPVCDMCLDEDRGNKKLAVKVLDWIYTADLSMDAKRGLSALLLACKYIPDISANKPVIVVHTDKPIKDTELEYEPDRDDIENTFDKVDRRIMTIAYGVFFQEMFLVNEDVGVVHKEAQFYSHDLRQYLVHIFGTRDITISKILIQTKDNGKSKSKLFYSVTLGVVWDNEHCLPCVTQFAKLGIKCNKDGCDPKARVILAKAFSDKKKYPNGVPQMYLNCADQLLDKACLTKLRHYPSNMFT